MDTDFNNILKYDRLRKILDDILTYINKEDYNNAYYKTVTLLEFVNSIILMKQFEVKLKDTSITNILNLYYTLDEELFNKMLGVNTEYNTIDDNIEKSDVEYLLMDVDYIVGYVTNKYGYDILSWYI